jgi:hypothetical protein
MGRKAESGGFFVLWNFPMPYKPFRPVPLTWIQLRADYPKAFQSLPAHVKSYIDEFDFELTPSGYIRAFYDGQVVSIWDSRQWRAID